MANSIESVKLLQQEIEKIISKIRELDKEILKSSSTARNFSGEFKKITIPSEINSKINDIKATQEFLIQKTKEREKAERDLISTIAKKSLLEDKESKKTLDAKEKLRLEINILRKTQRNELKAVSELSTAYEKLSAETNLLIRDYKDLAVQQKNGANLTDLQKKRFESLGKTIKTNQKVLKDTDAEVGQFMRNVGNYASAWDGLGNSINQLTREAPAFAVSLSTGFLAISNNLPTLFDEISKITKANEELIKQGKPAESVFSKIGKSIFSLQTLLSVGVTLLTVYGAELFKFIEKLTKGGEKARTFAQNQKVLNESYKEGAKSASLEIAQLQLLLAVASDKTKSDDTRRKAVDKLIKSSGGLIKEQDRLNILNGEAIEIENKLTKALLNKAIIEQLQQKISEDVSKLLEKRIEISKLEAQANDLNIKSLKNLQESRLEVTEEELKGLSANEKLIASLDKIKNATRGQLEQQGRGLIQAKESEETQKKVSKAYSETSEIQENINFLIREALKLTDNYTLSLDENTKSVEKRNRVAAIGLKTTEDQVKQLSKLSKIFSGLFGDFGNESLKEAQKDLDSFNFKSVERYLDALKNAESFKLPEIDQSSIDEMQARFAQLKIFEILDEEVKDNLEDGLEDLGNIISRFAGVNGQKFEDFFGKIFEVGGRSFEGLADIAESSFEVLGEITNAYFNNKIQQYENDIQANNEYYENLLENENLTDTERAKLELDRRAKEEELRKKQRKEEEKAAKFQKAIALAQIGIDLAKTITAINLAAAQLDAITFGVGGTAYRASALPQAIGLAAVQTAAVLASPIPKFAEGGVMDHDGLMQINDHHSGRLEIVERNGKLLMSNQKNAIVQGKKGDVIHKDAKEFLNNVPEDDLLKDINKYTMIATIQNQMNSALRIENKKIVDSQKIMADRIVKAIQKNKTNVVVNNNNSIGRELSYFKRGDF